MNRENLEPGSRSAAYRAAIRLLEHRDRSVADMTERLTKRGFDADCVEEIVERLKRERFIDDERFAARFSESMRDLRGHGSSRIRAELVRRGISRDLAAVAAATDPADERERATELAIKRAARLPAGIDRETAIRRVAGHLARKGFSADVVWTAAKAGISQRSLTGSGSPSIGSPASDAEQQRPLD